MFVDDLLYTTRHRAESMIDMVVSKVGSFTEVVVDSVNKFERKSSTTGQTSWDITTVSECRASRLAELRSIADIALVEVSCQSTCKGFAFL